MMLSWFFTYAVLIQPFQGWLLIIVCVSGFHPELFIVNPVGVVAVTAVCNEFNAIGPSSKLLADHPCKFAQT